MEEIWEAIERAENTGVVHREVIEEARKEVFKLVRNGSFDRFTRTDRFILEVAPNITVNV